MHQRKIFISHSSVDQRLATAFRDIITLSTKLSPEDILCTSAPGSKFFTGCNFETSLEAIIKSVDLTIFLISPNFCKSEYCIRELNWADLDKSFIFICQGLSYDSIKDIAPNRNANYLDSSSLDRLSKLLRDSGIDVSPEVWNLHKMTILDCERERYKISYISPPLCTGINPPKNTIPNSFPYSSVDMVPNSFDADRPARGVDFISPGKIPPPNIIS